MTSFRAVGLLSTTSSLVFVAPLFLGSGTTNGFLLPTSSVLQFPFNKNIGETTTSSSSEFNSRHTQKTTRIYSFLNIGDNDENDGQLNYYDVNKRQRYDEEALLQSMETSTPYNKQLGYIEERIEAIKSDQQTKNRVTAGVAATALAAGTAIALNNFGDVTAAAESMFDKVQSVSPVNTARDVLKNPLSSSRYNNDPAVSLPYLEEQIRQAEAAIQQRAMMSSMTIADGTATSTTETPAAPKPAVPAPPAATTSTPAATTTAAAPKPAAPVAATTSAATTTTPAKPTTPAPAATAAPKKVVVDNKKSPSLYKYTVDHIPQWVESGKKFYAKAEPVVSKASRDIGNQLEKNVIPKVMKVEHQLLGDEVAGVVDKAASVAVSVGRFALDIVGKTVPVIYEGGKQVVKAAPQVYKAGKSFYTTVDKKVIPEIRKDYKIVKDVVIKKTPEVIEAGKQVYDTGKQFAHAVEEDVLPKVMEAERKLAPEFNRLEHRLLGDGVANAIDNTAAFTYKQAKNAVNFVDKNAPTVISTTRKTAEGALAVGRVACETGKQVYRVADKTIPEVITATRIIATELDRTGGQLAYSIDESVPKITKVINRELPKMIETGRQVQRTMDPAVTQLAESGRAISQDVARLMANPSNFGIQLTPDEKERLGTFTGAGIVTAAAASAINSATSSTDAYSDSFGQLSSRRRFR